jgi:protocatechuate 3,4-dioxygenase beta subunit
LAALASACGDSSPTGATGTTVATTTTPSSTASAAGCVVAAEETAGPYPDTTGMANNPAFFRRDVREGRPGAPLTLALTIVNVRNNCNGLANANVEIWQCDASGFYSEYAQPGYNGTGQTYLRGLQTSDASGHVTFGTVYPGWYQGRATHIHVKVYVNGVAIKTTQIAFPEDISAEVYASGVYASKGQSPTRNAADMVFADGTATELASVAGSTAAGYTAALTIGVGA